MTLHVRDAPGSALKIYSLTSTAADIGSRF
jgi:hypothetical protein